MIVQILNEIKKDEIISSESILSLQWIEIQKLFQILIFCPIIEAELLKRIHNGPVA